MPDIANQIFHHVIALDAGHAPINARNWLLTCKAFATSESRVDLHRIDEMLKDKTFTDNCLQHKNQDIAAFAQIIKQREFGANFKQQPSLDHKAQLKVF